MTALTKPVDPVEERIRVELITRRSELKLTRSAVARQSGIPRTNIVAYEEGAMRGTVAFVARYAAALGYVLTVDYTGPDTVAQDDEGAWRFHGVEYPNRREARQAQRRWFADNVRKADG